MRPMTAEIYAAKNALASTEPLCWLLSIGLNAGETAYVTTNNEAVTYGGNTYQPFPLGIGDMMEDGGGSPTTLTISASNADRIMATLIRMNRGFPGRSVTLRLYSDGSVLSYGTFRIQGAAYNDQSASITVGNEDSFGIRFPRRRFLRDFCSHQFRGSRCGYAGAAPTCNHRFLEIGGCKAKGGDQAASFGGFPSLINVA